MKKKRVTYEEKANQIQIIVELAEEVITKSNKIDSVLKNRMLEWGIEIKAQIKSPEPKFRNVASLKILESDFLTYWNEAKGKDIELFWKKVFSSKLNIKRKDVLLEVLKRNRIKNINEFNIIVDKIVVAEQIGQINQEESNLLKELIGQFEQNKSNKEYDS